jgi:oligopeptide transport system substrate-binding protein
MAKFRLRTLLSVLAIFSVLAFAVACGDDDDDDDNGSSGGGGSSAPSGTITVQALQFQSWDPHFANFSQDIDHHFKVWRGLYEFDKDQKPVPSMADGAPKISSDGLTYTIKLKQGLKWSDGQPLDAQDFILGFQRTCSPDVAGYYQYYLFVVPGCEEFANKKGEASAIAIRAVDASTLEIKLNKVKPTFHSILALWMTFPVPKHLVKAPGDAWPAPVDNVYNGPFMVKAYTEKSSMELVPNPNWAGKEKPKVEKIVLRYIDDNATSNNAYRSGELDIALANTVQLDVLKSEFPKELVSYPGTVTIGLMLNVKDSVFQNQDVRFALAYATDRKTYNDVVEKGAHSPTTSWMSAARSGAKEGVYDSAIGFDPKKAKESLAKAGFPDGKGFPKLTVLIRDSAGNKAAAEFLQAEWKKHLGIELSVEVVDTPTRSARYNKSEFQFVIGGWGEDYPDPENWFLGLWETDGGNNKTLTSVKELDDLLEKAKKNTNDEQRRQQYRDAEKVLIEGLHGVIPLHHRNNHFLVKPHIKGVTENKAQSDSIMPAAWWPEFWSTTKK